MTVCIAANCHANKAVVVASDKMLTAPFLTAEFDHPDAKIDQISSTCVGLSAGDALVTTDLFGGFDHIVGQLQDPQINMIADHVKERFSDLRKQRII